jgi:hypothetical protein
MLLATPRQRDSADVASTCATPTDQQTLRLWARCYASLIANGAMRPPLVDVAAALLLGHLRTCVDVSALLTRYRNGDRDRELVERVFAPAQANWYEVRDAAYYLRWRELVSAGPPGTA